MSEIIIVMFTEKRQRAKDLADAVREGLSPREAKIRVTQQSLVRAVVFSGYAPNLYTFEAICEAWGGSRRSLDVFVQRAADTPEYPFAMGVRGLMLEVVGRKRGPGPQAFLLDCITAKSSTYDPKTYADSRSVAERIEALRAHDPEDILGAYLDGFASMTCDEVCARFMVYQACVGTSRNHEDVWHEVRRSLHVRPRLCWRRLARDALKGTKIKTLVY